MTKAAQIHALLSAHPKANSHEIAAMAACMPEYVRVVRSRSKAANSQRPCDVVWKASNPERHRKHSREGMRRWRLKQAAAVR